MYKKYDIKVEPVAHGNHSRRGLQSETNLKVLNSYLGSQEDGGQRNKIVGNITFQISYSNITQILSFGLT